MATGRRLPGRLQELIGYGIYNGLIGHIDKTLPAARLLADDSFPRASMNLGLGHTSIALTGPARQDGRRPVNLSQGLTGIVLQAAGESNRRTGLCRPLLNHSPRRLGVSGAYRDRYHA